MKKIASFTINHDTLNPGVYISRIDGDITTYDMRFVKPNTPPFLPNPVMHTIEHLFATYARNSKYADKVIYFGPMGCRTGFYFLTTGMTHGEALKLTQDALEFISVFEGDVPGVSAVECGNYLDHDLEGAKKEAAAQKEVLKNWTTADMIY